MYALQTVSAIKDILIAKKMTIAIAESVTSGHLQAAMSQAENARCFYQGGLTAYNLGQKVKHLGVEPIHALGCDCVSDIVSCQMALGVSHLFTVDIGVSITGYAAAVPEKNIRMPFAYYSICERDKILLTKKVETLNGDALKVQLYYTEAVLGSLLSVMLLVDN